MSFYPDDWPRCPNCGAPALDGHITCGSFECDEHGTRRARADAYARFDELVADIASTGLINAATLREFVRRGQAMQAAADEALVKWLLSQWVSELEPVVAWRGGRIVGLTHAGFQVGDDAVIVIGV